MSREVTLVRTLVYFDGAQLAVARDELGHLYLSVMLERSNGADEYILVPVSADRLQLIQTGSCDLYEAFRTPEVPEWFRVSVGGEEPMALVPADEPPDTALPSPGLHLTELAGAANLGEDIVTESMTRGRAVVHLRLAPPEAREQVQIAAERLARALGTFQELVRQAYRKVIQESTEVARIRADDQYGLEVFAFSAGSFRVHMQSRLDIDMFGEVELVRALEKVDLLMEHVSRPDLALQDVRANPGHVAGAYKQFLRFVVETGSNLHYVWASPNRTGLQRREISVAQAENLYESLQAHHELTEEEVHLTGVFVRANVESGVWALKDDDGKHHHGRVEPDSGTSLSGVVLDTQRYRLTCVERVAEAGSGDVAITLELRALRRL